MDPATIAASTVGTLLVPYLKKGAEKLAEAVAGGIGEASGKQIASMASSAWDLVKEAFRSPDEITTLGLFEKNPETFEQPVQKLLESKLKEQPEMAEKFRVLSEAKGPAGSGTSVITNAVNAGILNMQGAYINATGSTFAGVVVGANPPGAGASPPTPQSGPDAKKG